MKLSTLILLLALISAFTSGCADDTSTPSEEQKHNTNTTNNRPNHNNTANNVNHTNNDNTTNNGDNKPTTPQRWAGTWFIEVTYEITCEEAFREDKTGTYQGAWSIVLEGANEALTAQINQTHQMIGAGNEQRLTLSGTFPLKSTQQEKTSPNIMRRNEISLKLDDLKSADEVSGTISGIFETDDFIYDECRIISGQAVMTR